MGLLSKEELRERRVVSFSQEKLFSQKVVMLSESMKSQISFDVFLSHSAQDKDIIEKLVEYLSTEHNLSCYVDWIFDPQLDRKRVNRNTAKTLRARMNQCKELFYVTSSNSSNSRWMPWEVGYFDGKKGSSSVNIFPLKEYKSSSDTFEGIEYMSLYRRIEINENGRIIRKIQ